MTYVATRHSLHICLVQYTMKFVLNFPFPTLIIVAAPPLPRLYVSEMSLRNGYLSHFDFYLVYMYACISMQLYDFKCWLNWYILRESCCKYHKSICIQEELCFLHIVFLIWITNANPSVLKQPLLKHSYLLFIRYTYLRQATETCYLKDCIRNPRRINTNIKTSHFKASKSCV